MHPRALAWSARFAWTAALLAAPAAAAQIPVEWTGDLPAPARAEVRPAEEAYPNLYRTFGLSLGASALGNFNSEVSIGTDVLIGASLDLEDTLGIDKSEFIGRLDTFYAFNPRHRIDFSVFDINRSGSRSIAEDIQVGDVVIPAGEVATEFDTLVIKAAYRYNFVHDVRTAIGFSAGLHTMGVDLGLESTLGSASEEFKVTAPLPVIGLHGEYALSKKWKMLASMEVFQIDIGYFSGYLQDNRLSIEHDTFKNVGWGASLGGFRMMADMESGHLNADIEYAYQGLMIYLRGYL